MKKRRVAPGSSGELRLRAEHQLRVEAGGRRAEPKADAPRIVQELQIHQIELELQNEEMRQAKATADAVLEKYTDLYDFAPVGYFSLDETGLILEMNVTGATLLGLERSRLAGRRFQLFVAVPNRAAFAVFLKRIFAGHDKQTCEASLLKGGGAPFWADLEARSAGSGEGQRPWCRVAVIDISARKRAEEAQRRIDVLAATNRQLQEEIGRRQVVETALKTSEQRARQLLEESRQLQKKLRQVSHRILLVQENQRKEISRDLHDKISQILLGINLQLEMLARAPVFTRARIDPRAIRRAILPVRRLVAESVRIVHQFARELRPAMLDDLGLIPALRAYIEDFPKRKGQRIQLTAFAGVEALDNDKRTMLYRVTQEALANVAKHARARVVQVRILKAPGGVCLEIHDDGRGFEVGRLLSREWGDRLGLVGMRERVEMVGGRFSVLSAPAKGTTIRAEVSFGRRKLGG